MKSLYLSIIVPLYNEEECVNSLHEGITEAIDPLKLEYEIIFVDDGSKDNTFQLAKEIATKDQRLKIIKFRRNYGQTQAMAAGIDYARGEILVTMDGDLQNDPSDIPLFIERIRKGDDIACGWRHRRQDKLITRKIPSVIANWLIGKITGVPIKDNGCSLKAYRADIIKAIPLYSDMHRFIPAMTSLAGTKVSEIKVRHHPRRFGVSKYGIWRIYKVMMDLLVIKTILSSANRPLLLFGMAGILSMIPGVALMAFAFSGKLAGKGEIDFMAASSSLLFFILSFFLMCVGFLCELVNQEGEFRSLESLKARVE